VLLVLISGASSPDPHACVVMPSQKCARAHGAQALRLSHEGPKPKEALGARQCMPEAQRHAKLTLLALAAQTSTRPPTWHTEV
jgi:hypothetical protein